MARNTNKSTIFFEKNYDHICDNNKHMADVDYLSILSYPKTRLRDVFSKRENKFYLTGQPTINKFEKKD